MSNQVHRKRLRYIKDLVSIAQAAGDLLLHWFRTGEISYSSKEGRANLVTEADLSSQRLITEELSRLFPNIPVVGEEGETVTLWQATSYFLVDPLDGTLNFLRGIPFFAVSIALVWKGTPVVGVVHAPVLGETFYAARGGGTFLNGNRLRRQKEKPVRDSIAVTGWPYNPSLMSWARQSISLVQREVHEVRILGACSLEMCYVAAGFVDVYWEIGLCPWDLAAGWVIVKEAGGVVTDVDGSAFNLLSGRVLAASNKVLHRKIVHILEPLARGL